MTASKTTKNYKKKRNISLLLDILCFMGTAAFLVIYGFITKFKMSSSPEAGQISTAIMAVYGSLLISLIVGMFVVYFIKNKARNTVWMGNTVLSVYLFGTTGMWVILSLWAIDEFIFTNLYKHYREKTTINVEIDKRG